MSIAPQALERSVLESKERDELAVIAEAMGVKPSSRASKATLIDSILRQAGIETGAEERPVRRTRATKAATAARTAPSDAAADVASGNGSEPAPADGPVTESASGDAPSAAAAPTTADSDADSGAADGEQLSLSSTDDPAPSSADTGTSESGGPADASEAAPTAGEGAAATGEGTTDTTASAEGSQSAGSTGAPATDRGQGGGGGGGRSDDRPRDRSPREDRAPRTDNGPRGDRENRQSGGGGGGGGGGGQGDPGDPGNRRSRRRRGRDRGERDIQPDRVQGGQGQEVAYSGEPVPSDGLLDLRDEGYGFLRTNGYLAGPRDVYVSLSQVRRFGLRKGDVIKGASRPAGSTEKYPALLRIDTVNDMTVEEARNRPRFEDLTPLFPDEKLRLEIPGDSNNMVARIVDLISPIGKGQRGLIVSPPKAGKTTVLKQIAHSIEANNPDVHLMVLLVDERPEEVTDMRRSVKGEVIASTFDRPSDEHTQVAELASERAKRLVEMGRDVVIVLDGITRLARAYNLAAPASGRIMSGGLATDALYPPKKFFGSARNLEEGGSLTILATALIETGSKMDEVIFEEFKGTGNMELRLDRKLAERRIYPALEVNASSTRHEELLFERGQLQQVWKLRRVLNGLESGAGLELLMDKIRTTKSNDEFLAEIAKAPSPAA
jgi:transcription termination factor Rho